MFLHMILVDIVDRLLMLIMQLFKTAFSDSARWVMFSDG